MKLIDKDKIAAEIEKRLSLLEGGTGHPEVVKRVEGIIKGYKSILSFLDTLKVKEVDLEKEVDIEDAVHGIVDYPLIGCDFPNIYPNYKEFKEYCDRKGVKDNDKVKLIIIKEKI